MLPKDIKSIRLMYLSILAILVAPAVLVSDPGSGLYMATFGIFIIPIIAILWLLAEVENRNRLIKPKTQLSREQQEQARVRAEKKAKITGYLVLVLVFLAIVLIII